MARGAHIHVRSLEIGDFAFVQDLASKQSNFTVPPLYVIWLLLKIKGSICLVAEDSKNGPHAYLLAVPVEAPEKTMFVWQLASQKGSLREDAILALLNKFRDLLRTSAIVNIAFSTLPKSSAFRAIRRYAWRVFSSVPQATSAVVVDSKETEFLLRLTGSITAAG